VLERLTEKHQLVLAHLVYGSDFDKPMSVEETADRLRVRRRYIRGLLADALFKAEYQRMIEVARLLLTPRAVDVLGKLLGWEDQSKASGARVRLKAALAILDDRKAKVEVNTKAAPTLEDLILAVRKHADEGRIYTLPHVASSAPTNALDGTPAARCAPSAQATTVRNFLLRRSQLCPILDSQSLISNPLSPRAELRDN
jgi:hypothetical protein